MRTLRRVIRAICGAALALAAVSALAQKEANWTARDFRFHTGEVMSELRINYTTLGDPGGEPVLVLHGTTGTGAGMLGANFGGELFGPGQPLDAARYFSFRTPSATANRASPPTDCGRNSRATTTTTWCLPNTVSSRRGWG